MPKKLYIYDKKSYQDRWQAAGRFRSDDPSIVTVGAESKNELIAALTAFLYTGFRFDRALFQSHGDKGTMWFGKDSVYSWDLAKMGIDNPNFDMLFNANAVIYFDGCDVADGNTGEKFLRAAGKLFLKRKGGQVTGWTSGGFGFPGVIPFVGGHTVHPGGHLVTIKFAPGDTEGTLVPNVPNDLVLPALGT